MRNVDPHGLASPPRPLPELEQAWLDLFAELRRSDAGAGIYPNDLAAPFLSTALRGYEPGAPGTVMLVGKATADKNTLGSVKVEDAYDAATVKQRTMAVIEEVASGEYGSPSWRFARKLSDTAAEQADLRPAPLANLIWTNLAKVGVVEGNPPRHCSGARMSLPWRRSWRKPNSIGPASSYS